jgi:hypothetical protein
MANAVFDYPDEIGGEYDAKFLLAEQRLAIGQRLACVVDD